MDSLTRAYRGLPGLRSFNAQLLAMGHEILPRVEQPENDDLGYMAVTFLCKQMDHLSSIDHLLMRRDVVLIARSMLEGLWQLLWAVKGQPDRPRQWRAFASVEKWRALQRDLARGKDIAPEVVAHVEDIVKTHGKEFLRAPATRKPRRIGAINDPYDDNWRKGTTMRAIARDVGGELSHAVVYTDFSDWHHWGAAGLGGALKFEGNTASYEALSPTDAAVALATGFACLHQTCEIVDSNFSLGFAEKLQLLQDSYLSWHKEKGTGLS